MNDCKSYIQVILPLKLEWEPYYALPEGVTVTIGDRVKATCVGKTYNGVVSAVGVQPAINTSSILDIVSVETSLEKIKEEEITLWRKVAEYYMCSIGEVYKAAYPHQKITLEEAKAAALQKAREMREKTLNAMRSKVAKLTSTLEEKKDSLAKATEGTKKKAKLEATVRRLENEVQIASSALSHAENASLEYNDSLKEQFTQPKLSISLTPAQEEAYNSQRSRSSHSCR